MYFVDNDSGTDAMPEVAPVKSSTVKWFTKGGKGVQATIPGPDTWNIWQAELLNILNDAGIAPEKAKLNQLAQAIRILAGKGTAGTYLTVEGLLEEIADQGSTGQAQARSNIGITGSIAYQDKTNTFSKQNIFEDGVQINYDGPLSFIDVNGNEMARFSPGALNFALNVSNANYTVNLGSDYKPFVNIGGSSYEFYHKGNLKPVLSVNNAQPDAKGNVNVTSGIIAIRFGARGALGDPGGWGDHVVPNGCVMTGLNMGRNGDDVDIRNIYYEPLQATTDNVNWFTISGI